MEIPAADPMKLFFESRLIEEPEVRVTRGGQRLGNRVTFGEPLAFDLRALCEERDSAIPDEMASQLDQFEFWLLRLVCTLHANPGSKIGWFEIRIELGESGSEVSERGITTVDRVEPPIAYDLYPCDVRDEVAVEHTTTISPRFEFAGVSASFEGSRAISLKYNRLEPRITAYGKRESTAYWRFTPGAQSAVAEGSKDMDLIVRRRRGQEVTATVRVEGRGKSWGFFPEPVNLSDQRFSF